MTGRGGSEVSGRPPRTGAPRRLSPRAKWEEKHGTRFCDFADRILPWGARVDEQPTETSEAPRGPIATRRLPGREPALSKRNSKPV